MANTLLHSQTINSTTALGPGDAINVEGSPADGLAFQVSGDFAGTIELEGSLDGATWDDIDTTPDLTGVIVQIVGVYRFVRWNLTVFTSGESEFFIAAYQP